MQGRRLGLLDGERARMARVELPLEVEEQWGPGAARVQRGRRRLLVRLGEQSWQQDLPRVNLVTEWSPWAWEGD